MRLTHRKRLRLAGEDGFTMLFALLALFVGGLLVAAAFTAANGDIKLTKTSTLQLKAYYAALAGVQRYQYQLNHNPNYWVQCESLGTSTVPIKVPGTTDEGYAIKTLGSAGHSACEKEKQATILEATGSAKGTFRILSTGTAGTGSALVKRSIVATFAHPGFTKYVYESNYEVEDPSNFEPERTGCEHYYEYRVAHNLTGNCPPIEFAPEDKVNGPMHTNDAAAVCKSGGKAPSFGRTSEDPIEMNGGHYAASGCSNEPTIVGKYTEEGGTLLPPETDAELLETAGLKLSGRSVIVLKAGSPNTLTVNGGAPQPFPSNGVVYVENSSSGCGIAKYTPFGSDTEHDTGCGNAYVSGKYTESLTIASANDVIVNGNLQTTEEPNGEPTGGATLGLIAENFVRVYHPVKNKGPTTNIVPPTGGFVHNGKCVTQVTPEQRSGTISRTTAVSGISTTELETGQEVEGTGIETGTTISKVESGKIILSKAAKATAKVEASGKTLRSTEVTGITTTSLKEGQEVVGTGIQAGTVIAKVEAGSKIILSKAANPAAKEVTSSTKSGKSEVTVPSGSGVEVGQEVEGNGIPANTKITEIISTTKIKISNNSSKTENNIKLRYYGENTTLKFYGETVSNLKFYEPNGYQYNATKNICHEEKPLNSNPYDEYIASENRYIEKCETGTTYLGEGYCKYTFKAGSCPAKATNLNATEDPNGWGVMENPVIDAAILSTNHSWIVDNYECGASLGKLTVWGSIAQFWRGPVGTAAGHGYIKNYNYDERLANQQPPSFLSPSSTSWKVSRETAPPPGFTG